MSRKNVDIIIPIYNAYEDLILCLESIYKHTNLEKNRLILINDNSPDERIKPYMEEQKQDNVVVIHNENNKGFSNNINIGMAQSEVNDVILLNSDTVVTENWVEKMTECAYSEPSIGTVTPLSNNATLCSVPEFCEENKLPEGMTIEQAAKIVEQCSMKKYPRITVAHGFCMFVKREVIEAVGNFDAETFERGYGEENDFCNRAEQAGYHHVMCDNTYIYHSGTKSFISKEKERYIMLHDRILRERYPEQMRGNDLHVRDNPNGFVGENVGIYFDLANGKKNVLYVVQSDFRKGAADNIGGTQLHVHDLMTGLREKYNVFVAARNGHYLNLTAYYGNEEKAFKFYIGKRKNIYEFQNKMFEELWRNILSAFHIDLVHVHHVINASFDIFYVAKEYNIPIVFTAHDFYFVCPSIKMLTVEDTICIGKDTSDSCRECLNSQLGITDKVDYMKIWREKCAEVLHICKRVVVPDESASDILTLYYPFIKEKLSVIEHGYDEVKEIENEVMSSLEVICKYEKVMKEGFTYKVRGWAYLQENRGCVGGTTYLQIRNKSGIEALVPATREKRIDVIGESDKWDVGFSCVIPQKLLDGNSLEIRIVLEDKGKLVYDVETFETPKLAATKKKLNVAFIGGLNKAKGGEEVSAIVEAVKENVNWYVFGGIGVKKLFHQKQDNLVKTGYYMPEDLPKLLKEHEIDVIGILSIWPETYSYTLTEAILNGVPVIVTDIGALGRRTKELNCGWLVSPEHVKDDFVKIIKDLVKDRQQLMEYKENIKLLQLPDISKMAEKYQQIYEEFWNENIEYGIADYEALFEGYAEAEADKVITSGLSAYEKQQLTETKAELEHLKSSVSYRIIRKIWNMKIPGKRLAKKILLGARR